MIIAVGNQKGGTGKTSTVHALGETLASLHGLQVLMVDLDPQASLTRAAGVDPEARATMAEVMEGSAKIGQAVHRLGNNLLIAASGVDLSSVELGLVKQSGRTQVLDRALEPASKAVDVILIDLPPSLSLLTVNGLTAADGVIIPTRPTMLDVAGLQSFLDTVERARGLNPGLQVLGVLFTFYDTRIVSMARIIDQLQEMELDLFDTRIGQSIRVAEAADHGQSVVTYEPSNKRAGEYIRFTREVLKWLKT